ncbi:MAG: hypothetical protein H6Q69_448 [Firmicutes bacterium]|nr:hypothetical protein [Bacillota bacterium]MBP2657416.1 hypothetical protein [Bacillota bacterium]
MPQPSVNLGTANSFAVLAGAGITNTGPTTIIGDVGTFPITSETGFGSVTLIGTNHGGDAVTQQAKTDLTTAYNDAAGRIPAIVVAGDLGGLTLVPGVYKSTSSLGITGILTLDAQGDPNAVFIFQMGSTLTTASGSSVNLINGAQSCNIFWQVGSSATLGTGSTFRGNILALASITATTAVTVDGRLLASVGAVTLDTNTITISTCAVSLSLTKVCPIPTPPNTSFTVGDTVTITLTVTNSGSTAATDVTVLDQINIPANVQISSLTTNPLATLIAPPTGPYSNTNILITWTGLTIPAFSSQVLTVTFTILAAPTLGGVITNLDAGIGVLSGTTLFTCTIPVSTGVFLSLTKVCPTPTPPNTSFTVGDTVTITLTVTNSDAAAATGVTVVDQIRIPANVQISSLTTNPLATLISPPTGPYSNTDILITWTGLTIPAFSSQVLTVTFTILAAPSLGNLITNVDAGIGGLSGTNLFTCTIPVSTGVFLSLTKVCPTPILPNTHFTVGDTVTINLFVANTDSTDATGVTVVDQIHIPANVQISSLTTNPLATLISPPTGPYSNTDILITWTGLTIPALSTRVLTVTFTILAAPSLGNVITNLDAGIEVLSGTNLFACTIPVSTGVFLSLTKVCPAPIFPNTSFTVGDTVTINLTVINSDSTDAIGVTVVDQIRIPLNVQISSLTTNPLAALISPPTGPYSNTDILITWTGLTIPAFSSQVLTVTFTILAAPPQGNVITNVDAGIEVLSGTNLFTCTIPVSTGVLLNLIKVCPVPTPPNTSFTVGETVTITLAVINSASTNATGVTVVDAINIPANVQISSLTTNPVNSLIGPPIGPYSDTNVLIIWTGLTIPALSTRVLTATFTILAAPIRGGVITNVDAGIGVLSGTDQFTCFIPVSAIIPQRGIPLW